MKKNKKVAMETSAGNSGVIHEGFDPTPGKLTAKLNVERHHLYQTIFKELTIPYQQVNSLVIAFNDEEQKHLEMLYQRGITNNVDPKHLRLINQAEVHTLEPNLSPEVQGALLCTSSYVVDPVVLTQSLFSNSIKNNQHLRLDHLVTNIQYHSDQKHFEITTLHQEQEVTYFAKYLINAAGHYCDILAAKAGYPDYELVTKRGEYRVLEKKWGQLSKKYYFYGPNNSWQRCYCCPNVRWPPLSWPNCGRQYSKGRNAPCNTSNVWKNWSNWN
ncbi:FAD-dependent oxidoreductase [Spiroplasma endosymbiont of Glossina fuscipes fuscipes]|uniref:FAD-dependent oxidoreductase n=1 Tax=Spiroplasma endosymbiont of Glossina fuscipes fuscipes TaxID=2004463 RepID=UPI003C709D97